MADPHGEAWDAYVWVDDADGLYRLTNVPAGTVQLKAFFTGFPAVAASVTVAGGQTTQRDFELAPLTSTSTAPDGALPRAADAFRPRSGQTEMAMAVARTR